MTMPGFVGGLPGPKAVSTATHRIVFRDGQVGGWLSGGRIIDGTLSRDSGNTSDINVLRAGLEMGKVTSTGKYANSVIGLSNAAYVAGATSLVLTTAAAAEIARRIGASGTFQIVGPPAASGVVNIEIVTYSAITSTTATITALTNSYISGSIIRPTDGSQDFLTFIPDGYGHNVFLADGTAADQQYELLPTWGQLISANLLNWPTDPSLRKWYISQFAGQGEGKFVFDSKF